jgi:DNA invertase Pin-like site-specific DNA recombinase
VSSDHEYADASTPAGSSLPASYDGPRGEPTATTRTDDATRQLPHVAGPFGLRALGYRRVSTREQAELGASLEHQSNIITGECDHRGWHLAEMIEDAGASGKNLKRPGLERALELLAAGEAGALVAAKLDRLSRSVVDFASLLELSRAQGWALVVLDVGADTSTAAGEMLVNVMASFAQYERRLIGQRTRDGLAVKKAQGVKLGRPSTLSTDVVARIRRHRADGLSLAAIAVELNNARVPTSQGGRCWYASSVRAVLARQDDGVR